MNIIGLIIAGSVILLPGVAVLALRWAGETGQLKQFDRQALLPFDEQEPVGQATDQILGRKHS